MKRNQEPLKPEVLDQAPPSDVDAEQALLSSVLILPHVLDDVCTEIGVEDFYEPRHSLIFEALLAMWNNGKKIDIKLLVAHAKKAGTLVDMGGAAYLAEVMPMAPTAANAVHYARLIRDAAIKRELRNIGSEIVRTSVDDTQDAGELLNRSEALVLEVRDRRGSLSSHAVPVAQILYDAMLALDARADGRIPNGISSGFSEIDKLTRFKKSDLIVLAGRPSMGKTALALNLAENVAESGQQVLFFSLEMNAMAVADRLLSSRGEVDGSRMAAGMLTPHERTAIVKASAEISQMPLTVDDSFRLTVQDIAAVSRRHKRRHGLGLVMVDYLQLIQAENARDPREQQVARISARLKGIARELEVPVVCLAQLNRQVESGPDKRPKLSHLRESGSIEQDADVVMFVHRPEYYEADPDKRAELKGKAEVIVAKNRNGATGAAPLVWLGNIVSFRNAASSHQQNEYWDVA